MIVADWPKYKEEFNFQAEEDAIEYIENAIKNIRNTRSNMNIENSRKANTIIFTKDEKIRDIFQRKISVDILNIIVIFKGIY